MADASEKDLRWTLEQSWKLGEVQTAYNILLTLTKKKWDTTYSVLELDGEIKKYYNEKKISYASYKAYLDKKKKYEKGNLLQEDLLKDLRNRLTEADRQELNSIYNSRYSALKKRQDDEAAEILGRDRVFGDGTATMSGGSTSTTVTDSTTGVIRLSGGTPTEIGRRVTLSHTVVEKNNNWVDKKDNGQDPQQLDRRPAWIDTNTEYHRTKTSSGLMVDSAIIKRYYSVIDAEIYFGNEYVEDIADISWSIVQNVQPLFGYNSYTYDEVARGNRLIHGSFIINFTNPNYLFAILEAANKANISSITSMTDYSVPAYTQEGSNISGAVSGRYTDRERGHHANMWPQTFDIDIIFGEKSGASLPVHILLLGCAIQSCQQVLSASATGGPPVVMEQYSFVGQDIRTVVVGANQETVKTDAGTIAKAEAEKQKSADKTSETGVTDSGSDTRTGPSWSDFQRINDTSIDVDPEQEAEGREEESDKYNGVSVDADTAAAIRKQLNKATLVPMGKPTITWINKNKYDQDKNAQRSYSDYLIAAGISVDGKSTLTVSEQKKLAKKIKEEKKEELDNGTFRIAFKLGDYAYFIFTRDQLKRLELGEFF